MTERLVVDTSVWVDYFNGHASAEADRLVQAIAGGEPLLLPGIVLTEILLGLKTEADAERIAHLLDAFDPAPEPTWGDYTGAALIYRTCRGRGFTIRSVIDCLIGQLCLSQDVALLAKGRDFRVIAQCFPLRLLALAS